MIRDSGKKIFDVVLVWKLDRFARNRFDAVNYKYQLEKNGVHLVSAMEPISQEPEGIMESTGSFKVRISFSDIGLLSEELSWYKIQSYTQGRLVIEKISL